MWPCYKLTKPDSDVWIVWYSHVVSYVGKTRKVGSEKVGTDSNSITLLTSNLKTGLGYHEYGRIQDEFV